MSSALAIAAIATAVVGAGVSAAGSAQQGKNAANLANYNAQIAQNDAIAARQKAAFDAKALDREQRRFAGSQRASASATGGELLDMGDVFDMTAEDQEIDYLTTLYGGDMAARAAQQRATTARFEGAIAQSTAKGKAIGSLVTGAGSALSMGSKLPSGGSTVSGGPTSGPYGKSGLRPY